MMASREAPPRTGSYTGASGFLFDRAWRSSRRQSAPLGTQKREWHHAVTCYQREFEATSDALLEVKYPLETKIMMTLLSSMYRSRAPMSFNCPVAGPNA